MKYNLLGNQRVDDRKGFIIIRVLQLINGKINDRIRISQFMDVVIEHQRLLTSEKKKQPEKMGLPVKRHTTTTYIFAQRIEHESDPFSRSSCPFI